LETNDPSLAELVRRVDAGETIIETIVLLKHPKLTPRIRAGEKIAALTENHLSRWQNRQQNRER
jgi:antitoxin (DNA-binding transcriptional repressor) of toxin-antitoxin stability system